nr:transporter substrate-binding domain-containing protein [Clostridium botulinum]
MFKKKVLSVLFMMVCILSFNLTKELNKALKKVKESGKYQEIKNKWLSLEK